MLGLPPNIDPPVRVIQFIAILVAVVTQDDLMKGLDVIRAVYSQSFFDAFHHTFPEKTIACILLRCSSGCMGLISSAFLIITSETIYDLLLNFTALEFVSQLDAALFVVCEYGYAGKTCEAASKAVRTTTFYVHTKVYRLRKMVLFSVIALVLLACWSAVVYLQNHGAFQCSTLVVQFGDDMRPELGTFSGMYDQDQSRGTRYLSYVDRHSKTAEFAYCVQDQRWTFQYHENGTQKNADPCTGWVARSSETTSYDITATAHSPWFARDEYQREVHLEPFVLQCQDCIKYNTCSGKKG
jgi:hypothetical protein